MSSSTPAVLSADSAAVAMHDGSAASSSTGEQQWEEKEEKTAADAEVVSSAEDSMRQREQQAAAEEIERRMLSTSVSFFPDGQHSFCRQRGAAAMHSSLQLLTLLVCLFPLFHPLVLQTMPGNLPAATFRQTTHDAQPSSAALPSSYSLLLLLLLCSVASLPSAWVESGLLRCYKKVRSNVYNLQFVSRPGKLQQDEQEMCTCKDGDYCEENCVNRAMHIECTRRCSRGDKCGNQRLSRHQYADTKIVKVKHAAEMRCTA
jgi:hypothetical protein